MSDLQIGLLMLGVLVVAGVLAFNWYQERQFRRRAEQTFAGGHDDILFDGTAATSAGGRAGSRTAHRRRAHRAAHHAAVGCAGRRTAMPADHHCRQACRSPRSITSSRLRAGEIIPAEQLAQLRRTLATLGRIITFSGFDFRSKSWQSLALTARATPRCAQRCNWSTAPGR